jgi:type I restriction enzyme M protein
MTEGQGGGEFYTPSSIVQAARRDHRTLPRPHPRPRLRLGRHVRAVGALRRRAPEEPGRRAGHLRRRKDRRNRPPVPPQPRRAWAGRRHRHGGNVNSYYDDPHSHRPVRLRPRQSALQRQRGGQGTAQGHGRRRPPLPLRPAAHRQRQLPVDSALLLGAQRHRPRRLRHGQLGLRRPLQRAGTAAEADRSAGGGCDGRRRPQHVLHRHAALHAVVLDKGKAKTKRADTVLFIDARHIYRQVDRAHRDWTPAQIGFIANLVRLYRGEAPT